MFDPSRRAEWERRIDQAIEQADAPAIPASFNDFQRVMKAGWAGLAVLSLVIWIAPLIAALTGWQMIAMAVPARSVPTLAGVGAIGLIALVAMAVAWTARARMLGQMSAVADACVPPMVAARLCAIKQDDGRHLRAIRAFLNGPAAGALMDVPGVLLSGLILALIVPWIGAVALAAAGAMLFLSWRGIRSRYAIMAREEAAGAAEIDVRTIAMLRPAGMRERMRSGWAPVLLTGRTIEDAAQSAGPPPVAVAIALLATWLPLFIAGGWMALADHASMPLIAAAQALAMIGMLPLIVLVMQSGTIAACLTGWGAIRTWLALPVQTAAAANLPPPRARMECDITLLGSPGDHRVLLSNIAFTLDAGQMLTVIGPGGAGKSVLMRAIAGQLPVAIGGVRLDGVLIPHWTDAILDQAIGYMPQRPVLARGTIAENIARFDPMASSEAVLAAARTAGVHDAIVALTDGYDTEVGDDGERLNASMIHRIALARACFGDPVLLLLDDPTACADQRARKGLQSAIDMALERGAMVIVVTHEATIIDRSDTVLVLRGGRAAALAPPAQVRAALQKPDTRDGAPHLAGPIS
ncbi:ATP-binding cassette domain-containing protein [Sphingomonas sp. BGYR3]|uniref:ATP-binding cassette domain-containing protein n=1 Tax=Sphingomonas sp. BGYR3 TaxID=2975483 RepID=UPI0021A79476|nr:ATP-binding cassette domain-containing protein [Sphingomonas sp. BGYR3]MDG5489262.1 ATP-binding cassette domain-containing protein [Sphingomonas sp. BGYR3]